MELINATSNTPKFTLSGTVQAKCVSVYDGDTASFVFRIAPTLPLYKFSCRMIGYNSAEIRGGSEEEKKKAVESKNALSEKILNKIVTLQIGEFDKYGRPLVIVTCDGVNINQWMLTNNYGKTYNGRGEKQW